MRIISTLGPASINVDFLNACQASKFRHFRLNGSHMDIPELKQYIDLCNSKLENLPAQFYLDLQGYKIRIAGLKTSRIVREGEIISLSLASDNLKSDITLQSADFFHALDVDDLLILQDGQIKMTLVGNTKNIKTAKIIQGNELRPNTGICNPEQILYFDRYPDLQIEQIKFAGKNNIQNLALSYTQSAEDLIKLREFCAQNNYFPKIIAKIEHPLSLDNLESITRQADEVWLCRGDLGTFIPLRDIAHWQAESIRLAKKHKTPIIIAGQVFHHLTFHKYPTRSEIVHFSGIQQKKIAGIILSDETAVGIDPVNSLNRIEELLLE